MPFPDPNPDGPARRLVQEMLTQQGFAPGEVALEVDPRDEMLSFAEQEAGGDRGQGAFQYFRAGLTVAAAHHQVLLWRFGSWDRIGRLLDFASGFGRVTRFLVPRMAPERVWVCELQPGAASFQQELLGVRPLAAAPRPEEFVADGGFDAVLVTSLFTHLPENLFAPWLGRLASLLRPGGALVFSTWDPEVASPPPEVPPSGFLFHHLSESRALAGSDYGTALVDEGFVQRAAAQAAPGRALHRIPRGMANLQDLWVLVPEERQGFSGLHFQGAPELHLRAAELEEGALLLRGWAISRCGAPPREVEVRVDGEPAGKAPVGDPRPEVARDLGEPFLHSGWECLCPLPPGRERAISTVLLSVVDQDGRYWPLAGGTVPEILLGVRDLQVKWLTYALNGCEQASRAFEASVGEETAFLTGRLRAMEASRFWKLRNLWFRLKRALGVTDQE